MGNGNEVISRYKFFLILKKMKGEAKEERLAYSDKGFSRIMSI